MSPRNVGELILIRLKQLGVERFFANPGTEFASIIRGFLELPRESLPIPVTSPHEFLAVSMAYGYYLATGKAQAVMTHANVGAANALIGLIGASRMNIPLIFISGMTSQAEKGARGCRDKLIHWSQDCKDQGSMFREYVKWEAEISDPSTAADILDRAYAIAMSAPLGPVAIKISRDMLLCEQLWHLRKPSAAAVASARPSQDGMKQTLEWLALAKRPIVLTNRTGINPANVSLLSRICAEQQLAVMTPDDYYVSFPSDHPCHLGYRQGPALSEADLFIILDVDAPWFPLERGPNSDSRVIHVGPDPLFQSIPLRSHSGDLYLQSDIGAFLTDLTAHIPDKNTLVNRREWIRSHTSRTGQMPHGENLDARTIAKTLSEFQGPDTLLINELSLPPEDFRARFPGTYFRSGSASPLGWGVGCALGIKMAHPQRTVIAAIGDGVFYLSPMLASFLVSLEQSTPFITVVLNNGGMHSISKTVRDFYPEAKGPLPLATFGGLDFERCSSAVGGLGLRVTTATQLRTALHRSIDFCREEKRPVIINAIYTT